MPIGKRLLCFLLAGAFSLTLAGCSTSFSPTPDAPGTYTIRTIHGIAHGGQQPITSQSIYLYATGTSGVYSNARSVLTIAVCTTSPLNCGVDTNGHYYVTTAADGTFAITGDYTCSAGESLYIYGTGGNSGAGIGSNSHIGLLAALGTCASNSGDLSGTVSTIQLNEISTIATAYALAGFALSPTAIGSGSSAAAVQGMSNAVANVPNIYDFAGGLPLSSTAGSITGYTGTVPSNKMLWLADIIAACVNTDPSDSISNCANLFAAMPKPTGGTTANTAQVALNMAHTQSPSASTITTLTGLIPTQPAFPYSVTTYTDLALPVVYTSPMASAGGLAIDKNGYVWAFDYNTNISASTLYKVSPQGAGTSIAPASNSDILKFAISPHDNSVWVYNEGPNPPEIDGYTNSGSFIIQADVADGVPVPGGLAFNGNGDFFFSAGPGTPGSYYLEEDGPDGFQVLYYNAGVTGTPLTTLALPFVGLDSSSTVWLTGSASNSFSNNIFYEYASPYTAQTTSFSSATYYNPLVAGANAVMWYPDPNSSQLDNLTSSGISSETCSGGGLNGPQTIAVDGAGDLWTGNYHDSTQTPTPAQTISGFYPLNSGNSCSALTTSSGISNGTDPSIGAVPFYIAADSSGNIWTLNYGVSGGAAAISFTQFLGLSVPAVTPINPSFIGTTPH